MEGLEEPCHIGIVIPFSRPQNPGSTWLRNSCTLMWCREIWIQASHSSVSLGKGWAMGLTGKLWIKGFRQSWGVTVTLPSPAHRTGALHPSLGICLGRKVTWGGIFLAKGLKSISQMSLLEGMARLHPESVFQRAHDTLLPDHQDKPWELMQSRWAHICVHDGL